VKDLAVNPSALSGVPGAGVEAAPSVVTAPVRRRRLGNRSLILGLLILAVIVLAAVFASRLTPFDPIAQDLTNPLAGPGGAHLLGTDELGRDTWSRLLYGARSDLRTAFIAVLFPFVIGTTLGAVAGYVGRWFDAMLMRLADVVVAFPFYVLIIALVFALGPGTRSIYIAITAVGWVSYARIVRAETLVARRQEYVQAAKVGGLSHLRIIGRHILPNVISQAVVFAMSDIVLTILAIATLGYLGLGIAPPTPEWGAMISAGQPYLSTNWELATIPGLAVVLAGLGLALVGDGLADKLRVSR
jgi:peptide/nickel transport system permease protein